MKSTPIQPTVLAVALVAALPALAQQNVGTMLTPVIVTANGIPTRDSDATYASEVHDRAMIESSGATSLYDYLSQNSSLNVMPSYGNKNAPLLDMRGYGIGSGAQAVAIYVDGRRLNEVDGGNSLLGSIPLTAVESIEISKGSGSVAYGDSAMAGAINIRTRAYSGVSVAAITGSRGFQSLSTSAGLSRDVIDLSFAASNDKQGYSSAADKTGAHDGSDNRTEQAKLMLKPFAGLKLFADGMNAHLDTRYANSLTPAQFEANPEQNGKPGTAYTHQIYETRQMRVGAEYEIISGLSARYAHNVEDKTSTYIGSSPNYYDYTSDDISLTYRSTDFDLVGGAQRFQGDRLGSDNRTSKDNTGYYLQGVYRIGQLALSAGARRERVEYAYVPTAGASLENRHNLSAWDLGLNYRIDASTSLFSNLNSAYQAPNIDQFFSTDWGTGVAVTTFNQFISPAKSRTLNVGVNHDTSRNKLRATLFYSKLKNEFYYDPLTYTNTNLDKSHKYGVELQDRWQVLDSLSISALYSYTQARIDTEVTSDGTVLSGKDVPGVPRNAVTLGATWQPWANGTFNLNQVWRDSAYAVNDLSNNFQHRQSIYSATNVAFRQRYGKVEGYVGVDNLFDRANGIWVDNSTVYAVDFRRTLKVGLKADLF